MIRCNNLQCDDVWFEMWRFLIPWHFLTRQFLTPTIFQPTISHPTISHSTIYHPTISHFKYIILGQFLTPTIFQPTLSHQTIFLVFCDNFSPNLSSPLRRWSWKGGLNEEHNCINTLRAWERHFLGDWSPRKSTIFLFYACKNLSLYLVAALNAFL